MAKKIIQQQSEEIEPEGTQEENTTTRRSARSATSYKT
jgi:hypothetical protein